MSSAEFHLSLLDRVVCSAKRLCEGELCCLGHRKVSALCLLYEIYHTADHALHKYLHNFVASPITRASAALGELVLVIPRCRTNQVSRSFFPSAVRLWNLLSLSAFSCGTLSSIKSAMNLCLQRS